MHNLIKVSEIDLTDTLGIDSFLRLRTIRHCIEVRITYSYPIDDSIDERA